METRAVSQRPLVIGHRGACGYVPEHTLLSYFLAAQQGADYLEPDLVMTRDGVLVARHENEIGATTDVATHPEFADRKTSKRVDGREVEGWFVEDFTIAELKTLRARERIAQLRPANARFDGQLEIPTFEEILALAQAINRMRIEMTRQLNVRSGVEQAKPRRVGMYPETKHPSYFTALNLAMEGPLLDALERWDYAGPDAPVFIQSFEVGNLMELRERTHLPLVQLIESEGQPYDFTLKGYSSDYRDMIAPANLKVIATYADVIGVNKLLIIPRERDDSLGTPTDLAANAHAEGLRVHGWTFRAENHYLPRGLRTGDPVALGDLLSEIESYVRAGLDGFFTDHPAIGVAVRSSSVT